MELPDPSRSLNEMEKKVYGVDACIHPIVGCVIGHGNGTPEQQARSYLYSLRRATIEQIAGRAGDLSQTEYEEWMRRLVEFEKAGGVVNLPPQATAADHPPIRRR